MKKGNIHTEQFVILVVSAVMVLALIAAIGGSISDSILTAIEAALK
jgi:hypothetical protein